MESGQEGPRFDWYECFILLLLALVSVVISSCYPLSSYFYCSIVIIIIIILPVRVPVPLLVLPTLLFSSLSLYVMSVLPSPCPALVQFVLLVLQRLGCCGMPTPCFCQYNPLLLCYLWPLRSPFSSFFFFVLHPPPVDMIRSGRPNKRTGWKKKKKTTSVQKNSNENFIL